MRMSGANSANYETETKVTTMARALLPVIANKGIGKRQDRDKVRCPWTVGDG